MKNLIVREVGRKAHSHLVISGYRTCGSSSLTLILYRKSIRTHIQIVISLIVLDLVTNLIHHCSDSKFINFQGLPEQLYCLEARLGH